MIIEVPFYWVDKYPDRGGAMRTTGKQCGLAATGDYQPSLRSPWLAALGDRYLQSQHKTPYLAY